VVVVTEGGGLVGDVVVVVAGIGSGVVFGGATTCVSGGDVTAGPPVGDGFDDLAGGDDVAGPSDDALVVTGVADWVGLVAADEALSGAAVSAGGTAAVENSPAMVVEGPESRGRLVSTWDVLTRLPPVARTTAKATTTRATTTIPGSSSRQRVVHQSPSDVSHPAGDPPKRSATGVG